MFRVTKELTDIPTGLLSIKCRNENIKLCQSDFTASELGALYRHETVKSKLEKIYANKCCYCESLLDLTCFKQVEHYRPKANAKKTDEHNGYYWLRNDWGNLLLACQKCNTSKSYHFPLQDEAARVYHPPKYIIEVIRENKRHHRMCEMNAEHLSDEQPLLLNPEVDKLSEHILFAATGWLNFKTDRGEQSVVLCDLNREALVKTRHRIRVMHMFDLRKKRRDLIKYQRSSNECKEELRDFLEEKLGELKKEIEDVNQTYRGFRLALYINYIDFVLKPVCGESGAFFEFCRNVVLAIREQHKAS